ncbi:MULTISPECIES: hypothetical protein [unclassified Candidatus Cardinium]|uniref:hypothetical protein n=1 Tax=unclassified Candidatus Cardinium TaxID=2641185 RepID=UPI001FB2BC31|nr:MULTISPECIES: hypothetical protein [unclassified Candidatus Cardinium]
MSIPIKKIILLLLIPIGAINECGKREPNSQSKGSKLNKTQETPKGQRQTHQKKLLRNNQTNNNNTKSKLDGQNSDNQVTPSEDNRVTSPEIINNNKKYDKEKNGDLANMANQDNSIDNQDQDPKKDESTETKKGGLIKRIKQLFKREKNKNS